MADIFVSYSRQDAGQAQHLTELLTSAGLSVWIDHTGIDAAKSWSAEIVHAIDNCQAFVLMLSPHSVQSHNVIKEVSLASEKRKKILPIDLGPMEIPASIQYALAGLQRVSIENSEGILKALTNVGVADNLGGQRVAFPPIKNNTRRPRRKVRLTTLSVVLLLALGLYFIANYNTATTPNEKPKLVASDMVSANAEANALLFRALEFSTKATKNDMEVAIKLDKAAISKDSTFAYAYSRLARDYIGYSFLGDSSSLELAREAALKAVLLNNKLSYAYIVLADIQIRQGNEIEAIPYLRKALAFKPNSPDAWLNLGSCYQDNGQLNDAIFAYQQGIAQDPSYFWTYSNLAGVYFGTGLKDSARSLALKAKPFFDAYLLHYPENQAVAMLALCVKSYATPPLRTLPDYRSLLARTDSLSSSDVFYLVNTFAAQGDIDSVFRWFAAPQLTIASILSCKGDPIFSSIVADPRFEKLVAFKRKHQKF
jgi:tetratricopeptide (TPR) repeat protein